MTSAWMRSRPSVVHCIVALSVILFASVACEAAGRDAPAPTEPPGVPPSVEIRVYLPRLFADGTLGLGAVARRIPASDEPVRAALGRLIRGPDGDERAANFQYALDRRTTVVSVRVDGATGTVEFGEGLDEIHGRPFSELVYWSIVYTLTEVPGVDRVALIRDGRPLSVWGSPPVTIPDSAGRPDAPVWARPR